MGPTTPATDSPMRSSQSLSMTAEVSSQWRTQGSLTAMGANSLSLRSKPPDSMGSTPSLEPVLRLTWSARSLGFLLVLTINPQHQSRSPTSDSSESDLHSSPDFHFALTRFLTLGLTTALSFGIKRISVLTSNDRLVNTFCSSCVKFSDSRNC